MRCDAEHRRTTTPSSCGVHDSTPVISRHRSRVAFPPKLLLLVAAMVYQCTVCGLKVYTSRSLYTHITKCVAFATRCFSPPAIDLSSSRLRPRP